MFLDGTVRVWNLNDITLNGKSLDEVHLTIKDAVEISPVEVQVSASRLGVSSMDGSLKVYDLDLSAAQAKMVVNSNNQNKAALQEGETQYDLDIWRFCFNPRNSSQLVTG